MKDKIIYALTIFFSLLYIIVANKMILGDEKFFDENESSRLFLSEVQEIISKSKSDYGEINVHFKALIIDGEEKGETVEALQMLDQTSSINSPDLKIGDKIYLYKHESEEGLIWYADQYDRAHGLIILAIAFVGFVIIFGRKKGVNTIIALVFTCLSVFNVYVPAILKGYNIYLWSIITCLYIGVSTLLIVQGTTKKSFASMIGCLSGTAVAGVLTYIMSKVLTLTGVLNEESLYLYYMDGNNPIDLRAIIFGSIIVGAIGAIMDVSIDISSSLNEVVNASEKPDFKSVVKAGFEIGRDIIGTMANTLVLAYIGSSLSCTLLIASYSGSITYLLNREAIIVEILQALAGSIGIFFTIPLTTYICAFLYLDYHKKDRKRKYLPIKKEEKKKKEKITEESFKEDPWKV